MLHGTIIFQRNLAMIAAVAGKKAIAISTAKVTADTKHSSTMPTGDVSDRL